MIEPDGLFLRPATSDLPEGHEAVAQRDSEGAANAEAQRMIREGGGWCYYLQSTRGSWEVVRYRP
jgi:hypothetical protein